MIRHFTLFAVVAALVLPVASASATSCHSDAKAEAPKCDIERSCENLDNGIRCTIKAKGDTTEAQVRECVRKCHSTADLPEGVLVEFNDIEGGTVVTATSNDADTVKHLQTHAGSCAKTAARSSSGHGHGHKCAGHGDSKKCCSGHGHGHGCCSGHGHGHRCCSGHGHGHGCCSGHGESHKCAGHGDSKRCCSGHGEGHKCAGHEKPAEKPPCPHAAKATG